MSQKRELQNQKSSDLPVGTVDCCETNPSMANHTQSSSRIWYTHSCEQGPSVKSEVQMQLALLKVTPNPSSRERASKIRRKQHRYNPRRRQEKRERAS
eukprot:724301-Amphidinium_carterae.1